MLLNFTQTILILHLLSNSIISVIPSNSKPSDDDECVLSYWSSKSHLVVILNGEMMKGDTVTISKAPTLPI